MSHGRFDVIAELQSLFPVQQYGKYLLWSQFEKALTQNDKAAVEGWDWNSMYLAIEEDGKEIVMSGDILDTAISDIVMNSFSAWVNDIEITGTRIFTFNSCEKFITDALQMLQALIDDTRKGKMQPGWMIPVNCSNIDKLIPNENRVLCYKSFSV